MLSMGQVRGDSEAIPMWTHALSMATNSVGAVVPRTLQESGTVVERVHPDVSAPSARQNDCLVDSWDVLIDFVPSTGLDHS